MSNLLQIHEPGETPLPHASAAAIGIDLGTTHSVVAVASAGKAETMADAAGATLIPSVVQYGAGAPRVGKIAKAAAARGEAGVVASIKRLMGKSAADVAGQALPYTLDDACEGVVRVVVGDAVLTPIEVSAEILCHLRAMAEQTLGHEVTQAVITVPAYFDDAARAATRDAARMAGLTVLRLINEPTAAALAYGLDAQAEGVFAIYDFGGGTFDISILKLEQGVFQVLATAGDTALGGDDIDHAIAAAAMDHAGVSALAPEALAVLLGQCRAAKEALCNGEMGPLTLTVAGAATPYLIDLPALERLMEPLIARTLACAEHAVRDAGLTPHALTGVVLVGGSTRIPLVKAKVAQYFGRPALDRLDPDRVVALGAALQAEALTQGSDTLLLDVIPLSLGLETMGGLVEKLLYRNTPIPAAIAQEFTTYQDGQTAMKIHVLQGEREKVTDCRSLATFTLRGIPPMVAGAARIRVRFEVDADGLLMVSATELTTGTAQEIAVKPSYGLAFEEIERMVAASMEHARADISERLLIEARVGAERLLAEVRAALAADHALLKPGEEAMIAGQVARLEGAVAGASRDRIDHEVMALNGLVGSFAERRMNAAIACALAGRTVDEV